MPSRSVTLTRTPWDLDVILFLPDGVSPVDSEVELLEIYTAMVVGLRSRDRDFSDEEALAGCPGIILRRPSGDGAGW